LDDIKKELEGKEKQNKESERKESEDSVKANSIKDEKSSGKTNKIDWEEDAQGTAFLDKLVDRSELYAPIGKSGEFFSPCASF
jgi:hypothetical protein